MSDEITIDGEQFVSSRRASELSGYNQDYIGQLSRGGHILARRVGGLWYISSDSLTKYMARAEAYKPVPPTNNAGGGDPADALLSFDGRGYVSAARAAKLTGYSADYVGQMARAGIIPSRQVGNRWYVEQLGIFRHKESKDALLAAVQVESVGLKTGGMRNDNDYSSITSPFFKYTSDNRRLMPSTGADTYSIGPSTGDSADFMPHPGDINHIGHAITPISNKESRHKEETSEEEFVIPIRVHRDREEIVRRTRIKTPVNMPVAFEPRRAMLPMVLTAGLFTIVIVLSLGFVSLKESSLYTNNVNKEGTVAQLASAGMGFIIKTADLLEILVAPELVYKRPR